MTSNDQPVDNIPEIEVDALEQSVHALEATGQLFTRKRMTMAVMVACDHIGQQYRRDINMVAYQAAVERTRHGQSQAA